jgi:hypothetical protein
MSSHVDYGWRSASYDRFTRRSESVSCIGKHPAERTAEETDSDDGHYVSFHDPCRRASSVY